MPGSILGSAVRRREDPRLVTGAGRYVDDLAPEGTLHAVFARSPLAHARLRRIDMSAAAAVPGVVAALTAADLDLPPRLSFAVVPEVFARPPLAVDVVRFVGEAVAVVVGESRSAAVDGAEAVSADYDPLPVVATPEQAAAEGAGLVREPAAGARPAGGGRIPGPAGREPAQGMGLHPEPVPGPGLRGGLPGHGRGRRPPGGARRGRRLRRQGHLLPRAGRGGGPGSPSRTPGAMGPDAVRELPGHGAR